MTLKIKKITIENFRGIRQPLIIDFNKVRNFTSASIYGRNGTGKSSILNAWEWLLNFEIDNLKKEGVSSKDYPHKACAGINSYINVEFEHPTINSAKVEFNPAKTTVPIISGDYSGFKDFCKYPNYLRYSDLQDFVYKTKNEKFKYIAKYFGLENYTNTQSQMLTFIKKLTSDINNLNGELTKYKETLKSIIGNEEFTESEILNYFNTVANRHSLSLITKFGESKKIRNDLKNLVAKNPKIKELTEWQSFQSKLNSFYPFENLQTSFQEIEIIYNELRKEEANITKLFLSDLYKVSLDIIPKLETSDYCPLCDKLYDGDIINHIKIKHFGLSELSNKKNDFDIRARQISKSLEVIINKSSALNSETSPIIRENLTDFFSYLDIILSQAPITKKILSLPLLEIEQLNFSNEEFILLIEEINTNEIKYKQTVHECISKLEEDEANKQLADDFSNVNALLIAYYEHMVTQEKVNYLNSNLINLENLYTKLTSYIQVRIQTIFSRISTDVHTFYNTLEGSNPFLKNPEIKLVAGKDKAVELEIEFNSERITPAYKFMSESQVNSFGLSIFLAAVKYFNEDFKFFILDDVVNSFDNYKRPKVSQLLASSFSDFQILLLTHDDIFFQRVQRTFPNWNRYKFTNWDYNIGPRYKIAKSYFEEIQDDLNEDEPIKAGQALGRYLEWTLGTLCENLETPLPYRVENSYTLSDFFNPLKARFDKFLKRGGTFGTHKLLKLLSEFADNTFFRNFCAHWKNEASSFTTPEIQDIFNTWKLIEDEIFCETCKSYSNLKRVDSQEYLKCNCGTIDLKDIKHYN